MLLVNYKDSIIFVYLYFFIFLWVLVGFVFIGNEYLKGSIRLVYIKFNLEYCFFYGSMVVSGMIFVVFIMCLFSFVDLDIGEFYFSNVVLFGVVVFVIVIVYLVLMNFKFVKNIILYIFKIFSFFVLIILFIYFIMVIWIGKNLFLDCNFLMVFNGILFGVLVVIIFFIVESDLDEKKNILDYINFFLIVLVFIIDIVVLLVIVFRFFFYGIIFNRFVVLGVNILIWVNFIWIMFVYMCFL